MKKHNFKSKRTTGVIYAATGPSGKVYIGQTIDLKNRIMSHNSTSFNPKEKDYNSYFHRAIRKHGVDAFTWSVVLDEIPLCLLNDMEKQYIIEYNSNDEISRL